MTKLKVLEDEFLEKQREYISLLNNEPKVYNKGDLSHHEWEGKAQNLRGELQSLSLKIKPILAAQ